MLDDSYPTARRTKIIATIGPSSRSPQRVSELIMAGVNVFRFNFSHGSHAEHLEALKTIRTISQDLNRPIAVLQDLSGPKIRISNVEGDATILPDQETVELRPAGAALTTAQIIYVEGVDPTQFLEPGHPILLADGMISLKAEKVSPTAITCRILKGGRLRSRVGIAFPDSAVDLPATTEKDFKDLDWGIANGVDYVAISFVKSAEDILRLRKVLQERKSEIRLIAKIERKRAIANIKEILEVSDGIMVARGDLGLEVPLEKLPGLQRQLIQGGNQKGIPVIVATQMLHSMITSVRPTRAEVSDISLAVSTGADVVMLSDETAIGEHPVESVKYLSRIAQEAEQNFAFEEYKLRLRDADRNSVPDAVSYAACAAAVKIGAGAIVALSETGTSARLVAKYRPQQPLYGASTQLPTLRRMALYWGVIPVQIPSKTTSHFEELEEALKVIRQSGGVNRGSRAVIIGGLSANQPGSTSIMQIKEIVE